MMKKIMKKLWCISSGASLEVHHPYTLKPVYINIVFYEPSVLAPHITTWDYLTPPDIVLLPTVYNI